MADEMGGRIQEVEKAVTALESRMREQLARQQSATRTILIVGIILVAVMFVYLTILVTKIKEATEPVALAESMAGMAKGQIDSLERGLKAEAPRTVEGLINTAKDQIPELRKWAEAKTLALADHFGDRLDAEVDKAVAELLKPEHTKELRPLIEAAAAPGNADKLEESFQKSLEELLGPKLDEVLKDFSEAMQVIDHKLIRLLQADAKLTPEENFEREMVTSVMVFIDESVKQPLRATPPTPAPATAPVKP